MKMSIFYLAMSDHALAYLELSRTSLENALHAIYPASFASGPTLISASIVTMINLTEYSN
jgi:hypothetical protein